LKEFRDFSQYRSVMDRLTDGRNCALRGFACGRAIQTNIPNPIPRKA